MGTIFLVNTDIPLGRVEYLVYVGRSVGQYVCRVLKCVGGITYAHSQSQFWAVKTDL